MDPVRNPFAPGAGSQPPELAGRDEIIADAKIALQRVVLGRHDRSSILVGLRGTGKTVLLNKIQEDAEEHHHVTSQIEAQEKKALPNLLYPRVYSAIQKLSVIEAAKSGAYEALRALRSFASAFKLKIGNVSISVDPLPGTADSGNLEYDITDLFLAVGEAAKVAGKAWSIYIDEVQYLRPEEMAALIVGLHKTTQRKLPVLMFAAGLPQTLALTGTAKSYAERLFSFRSIGQLPPEAAADAIRAPIIQEGEAVTDEALAEIYRHTQGYPYFLQEWGFQAWNMAQASPISASHVTKASSEALRRLDDGFFRVRFDRLTPKEKEYVFAMAELGDGPYRSGDVAARLGEEIVKLGTRRAGIIRKGMIYSPAHGDIDFTVPMFGKFLSRIKAAGGDQEVFDL